MTKSIFKDAFKKSLNEAVSEADLEPSGNPELTPTDADKLGTDPTTPEGTFDDVDPNPMATLQKQQNANTITKLQEWISSIEDFTQYLNGLDDSSINSQINRADCNTTLADVQRSESKKISRLAQDLSSLSESLKQYLIVANHKAETAAAI